ncbi:MAG: cell division protein FtsA [Acidobacteriota bacterium]
MKKGRYLAGIDIGTTKTCVLIGEVNESDELELVGMGQSESKGLKKGVIIDLEEAVKSVKRAIEEAELMSGINIESAYVGVAGAHIKGINSRGAIAVGSKTREVRKEDIYRVIDAARAISIPADRTIIHLLPQEFIIDGQDGIIDPTGIYGARIEVCVHLITGLISSIQNIVACVNKAGVEVIDTILQHLACSEAVLPPDERELGVALIDIGGGTANLSVFKKGNVWHTGVLALGGDHFTNDIAVGLRTPIPEAENIKRKYGCVSPAMVEEDETIEVPGMGGLKPRILPRSLLCEIIQPRAKEILNLAYEEIRKEGYGKNLNSGIVLTGGGSNLAGIAEAAEELFNLPVRIGSPMGIGGLKEVVNNPMYSTAVGLLLYPYRHKVARESWQVASFGLWDRTTTKLRRWLAGII